MPEFEEGGEYRFFSCSFAARPSSALRLESKPSYRACLAELKLLTLFRARISSVLSTSLSLQLPNHHHRKHRVCRGRVIIQPQKLLQLRAKMDTIAPFRRQNEYYNLRKEFDLGS